eukprot:364760-Chlamydomonas_euryale.AAC.4
MDLGMRAVMDVGVGSGMGVAMGVDMEVGLDAAAHAHAGSRGACGRHEDGTGENGCLAAQCILMQLHNVFEAAARYPQLRRPYFNHI